MHNKTIPTVILGLVTAGLVGVIASQNSPKAYATNCNYPQWAANHPAICQTTTTAQQTTTTEKEDEDTTTTVATTVPEETTTTVTITVDSLPPVEETAPPITALTQQVLGTLPATR